MTSLKDPAPFSTRLRAMRVALGLTQAALAANVGCSAEMLRKFEAGAKRPSLAIAERLAERFRLEGAQRDDFLAALGTKRVAPRAEPLAPPHWFPQTKLHPPRPRSDLLLRPRLVDPLYAALQHTRLVLISAPAGAGKTTLLATALAELPRASAWVSLDPDDNDLARFLAVLLAALDQLAPGAGSAAGDLAQVLAARSISPDASIRQAVATLINVVLAAPPVPGLLILDDLHVIDEPAIHTALAYLIDQLPTHLSLAITTRHDPPLPLARLRARRELLELRLPDLRFTTDEAANLLIEHLGLPLSADNIAALYRRTEGWAAGLSLLAASLAPLSTPEARTQFLAHLAQTDRYIFDYLAEEVLNRQDPVTRTFLLETAILSELTPQACQGLTGFANAPAILDELYRRNLFLIQLRTDPAASSDQAFYRYHDLFRAFLLERLRREAPEWLRDLHRRAVACVGDPLRMIEHLIQAELWDAAAAEIEAV
ncbi:MAG: helix-turn-helix domain-containing protein, partial [Oscillochloris sp.]|nr:helix-turn-helix domain-containing protein [Oscillochloris sp.]